MTDLLERLIAVEGRDEPGSTRWYRNPDGPEAARVIAALREALEIIAGERQCLDNRMGNADVARAALAALNVPAQQEEPTDE